MSQNSTVEDLYYAYMMAWELGCKGVTVYVQNSRDNQVLSAENKKLEYKLDNIEPVSRSILGKTYGTTVDKRSACGKLFITINRDEKGNIVESFVNVGKSGICKSNIDGINRLVSLSLRSGVKVEEIIDQLKGIVCPACTKVKAKGDKIDGLSCADIIGRVLGEEYKNILKMENGKKEIQKNENNGLLKCPECGEFTLTKYDGCIQCTNCSWNRCL
jgi:ribonucleoside-diphosphate reductase alpha chain